MKLSVWESLEAEYKPKVIALAERVRKDLTEAGCTCSEVFDFIDEDLDVSFVYYPEGASPDRSIYLTFRLMDAEAWDGMESGTSFALGICEYGGQIVGGFHPYNYSPDVWVNPEDAEAVRNRWRLFESVVRDSREILATIDEFREATV
jgi:hypothetical protein